MSDTKQYLEQVKFDLLTGLDHVIAVPGEAQQSDLAQQYRLAAQTLFEALASHHVAPKVTRDILVSALEPKLEEVIQSLRAGDTGPILEGTYDVLTAGRQILIDEFGFDAVFSLLPGHSPWVPPPPKRPKA